VLEAFLDAGGHVTIDDLLRALGERHPEIGQATVYRAMKLFVEGGLAQRHVLLGDAVHYELILDGDDHHDHVICASCGRIFEFYDPIIEERQEALARRFGMRVVSHRHVIVAECLEPGGCERCHEVGGTQEP